MSGTQTPAVRQEGEALTHGRLTFEEQMNLPGATLDNVVDPDVIGAYGLEYDGPRCDADGCRTPVADDDELCDECCAEQPVERPVLIAVDADCPGCGYPERSFDPARGVFACSSLNRSRCGYESTERDR